MRPENYCDHLIQSVAELTDRLRHFSVGVAGDSVLPSCTARLDIAVLLLGSDNLRTDMGSLAGLGDAVGRLLSTMRDSPGQDLSFLGPIPGNGPGPP